MESKNFCNQVLNEEFDDFKKTVCNYHHHHHIIIIISPIPYEVFWITHT